LRVTTVVIASLLRYRAGTLRKFFDNPGTGGFYSPVLNSKFEYRNPKQFSKFEKNPKLKFESSLFETLDHFVI